MRGRRAGTFASAAAERRLYSHTSSRRRASFARPLRDTVTPCAIKICNAQDAVAQSQNHLVVDDFNVASPLVRIEIAVVIVITGSPTTALNETSGPVPS